MNIYILIAIGFLPSIAWLAYYLRKDRHPEPKILVIQTFIAGMVVIPLVYGIEVAARAGIFNLPLSGFWQNILFIFLGIALVEELMKFAAARAAAFSDKEFDEPTDAMIYMIVAALGFAAIENTMAILWLEAAGDIASITTIRFAGATFLHTLASGIFGYFIAVGYCRKEKYWFSFLTGLALATAAHGLFNYFITANNQILYLPMLAIIVTLNIIVLTQFYVLKKNETVCKINA